MQNDKQQVHVHIERWQDFVEILEDRRKVLRLAVVIIVIGMGLFVGITFLVLQLKKSFTYSEITTNALGATTIIDEQKEVSYFLFNTAELWANSGIEVEEGDVISIHSSGRANTAIHHLYNNAEKNLKPNEEFFDAGGERIQPESEQEKLRSEYRIFPKLPQSALVMQVVEKNAERNDIPLTPLQGTPQNFYYIGAHSENIHISQSGTLYFAINDIVLDDLTIVKMMVHNLQHQAQKGLIPSTYINQLPSPDEIEKDQVGEIYKQLEQIEGRLSKTARPDYIAALQDESSFHFGGYKQKLINTDADTIRTEMDYYYKNQYRQAWYDDNVGSFLILVEKDYRK